MAAPTTDLRKLVKITSNTTLYATLAHNGPSKNVTQDLHNRCLDANADLNTIITTALLTDRALIKAEYLKFCKFAKYASCACPNVEVVQQIAAFASEILEIGSGTGLWAKLLGTEGCMVTATDIAPPAKSQQFTKVSKLSCADALKQYPDIGCIFMCISEIPFPTEFTGDRCVVIGGDPSVALLPNRAAIKHNYLMGYPTDVKWELVDEVAIPTWWGERCLCRMYSRRAVVDVISDIVPDV